MINVRAADIFVVVLLLVLGARYMIQAAISRGEEQTACKTFAAANDAVAREFGSIRKIEPSCGGTRKFGSNPSGRIVFRVDGEQRDGYLSVSWIHQGDKIVVTGISEPLGFWQQASLWPQYNPSTTEYAVPFHVWYKLGYAMEVLIATLIITAIAWRRRVYSQLMNAARSETIQEPVSK